jgi:transcriptional regulator with XRE-family HTH domain
MPRPTKDARLVKIGERIRTARRALKWSQEDLADKAGIDRSYIGGVERGERNLSFTTLCKIVSVLGVTVSRLTEGIGGD